MTVGAKRSDGQEIQKGLIKYQGSKSLEARGCRASKETYVPESIRSECCNMGFGSNSAP
jgi:hypothetical protein